MIRLPAPPPISGSSPIVSGRARRDLRSQGSSAVVTRHRTTVCPRLAIAAPRALATHELVVRSARHLRHCHTFLRRHRTLWLHRRGLRDSCTKRSRYAALWLHHRFRFGRATGAQRDRRRRNLWRRGSGSSSAIARATWFVPMTAVLVDLNRAYGPCEPTHATRILMPRQIHQSNHAMFAPRILTIQG